MQRDKNDITKDIYYAAGFIAGGNQLVKAFPAFHLLVGWLSPAT